MPIHYLFTVSKNNEVTDAEEELIHIGLQDIYILENVDGSSPQIGGYLPEEKILPTSFVHIESFEKQTDTIDWEKQWSEFSYGFNQGKAYIDLEKFGGKGNFVLIPGKGFGDLSHPTTTLCLEMLISHFQKQSIIDIGCGSGVLSIAAKVLGSKEVYAVDIDEYAIEHTRENAELNHIFDLYVGETLPFNFEDKEKENLLILMNMTYKEQILAWESNYFQINCPYEIITSGILKEQKDNYLKLIKAYGWEVIETKEKEGWICFYCKSKKILEKHSLSS